MDGRTVLITGGNTGLGLETAVALAREGAPVVITSRDTQKGAVAQAEIRERSGSDDLEVVELDLASLASVREFAPRFAERHDHLDVLVNNAGVMLGSRRETVDGYEMTFQVNHLGPFLLTNLLRDLLVAGDEARVVNVASAAHSSARRGLDFDDLQAKGRYRGFSVYGKSKLANILFTRELARRWDDTGITANAVHPGFVASRFGRDGDGGRFTELVFPMLRPFAHTPIDGARTQVYVASAPELTGITGGYWAKSAPATPSAAAQDDAAAARLWEVSEQLVA
jgi:NAD(P)-dependent dehydrogenase (short-subunit alcohol dehydrogenase family)